MSKNLIADRITEIRELPSFVCEMNKVEKTVQSILDNHQKENYQDIILSLVNNSNIDDKQRAIDSIFSSAKEFNEYGVSSPQLNTQGLHALRISLAQEKYHKKLDSLNGFILEEEIDFFKQNGYLCIENFLPNDQFEAISSTVEKMVEDSQCTSTHVDGTSKLLHWQIDQDSPKELSLYTSNERLENILKVLCCQARYFHKVEFIKYLALEADKDPQADLHKDTFHPTFKWWYFLRDVKHDNGPLNYIPGSNQLTFKRLCLEYKRSLDAACGNKKTGSFRFNSEEIEYLGLNNRKEFDVNKNTFVFADTYGIHARGITEGSSERLSIWGMANRVPFY